VSKLNFDGAEYGEEYLILRCGDVIFQVAQPVPVGGWAFGLRVASTGDPRESSVGWFPEVFLDNTPYDQRSHHAGATTLRATRAYNGSANGEHCLAVTNGCILENPWVATVHGWVWLYVRETRQGGWFPSKYLVEQNEE